MDSDGGSDDWSGVLPRPKRLHLGLKDDPVSAEPFDEALTLRRRTRDEVVERLPPLMREVMVEWEEVIRRVGWRGGFRDFNVKLLELMTLIEVVLPDAPTEWRR